MSVSVCSSALNVLAIPRRSEIINHLICLAIPLRNSSIEQHRSVSFVVPSVFPLYLRCTNRTTGLERGPVPGQVSSLIDLIQLSFSPVTLDVVGGDSSVCVRAIRPNA